MANLVLGSGSSGGTWSVTADNLLTFTNDQVEHVYAELGPLAVPELISGRDGRDAIVDNSGNGDVRRILMHEGHVSDEGVPRLTEIETGDREESPPALYPETDKANWRWYGNLLVCSDEGKHYAIDGGVVSNLGHRIDWENRPAFVEELMIEVFSPRRWTMHLDDPTQLRLTRNGSLTRIRLRRIPDVDRPPQSGVAGPTVVLRSLDEQGIESTVRIESFDEEMSWDEGDRLVRRIPFDNEEFEVVISFDPKDDHHAHGMARAIVDSIRLYRRMPDFEHRLMKRDHPNYEERLASGENPDGWLY